MILTTKITVRFISLISFAALLLCPARCQPESIPRAARFTENKAVSTHSSAAPPVVFCISGLPVILMRHPDLHWHFVSWSPAAQC